MPAYPARSALLTLSSPSRSTRDPQRTHSQATYPEGRREDRLAEGSYCVDWLPSERARDDASVANSLQPRPLSFRSVDSGQLCDKKQDSTVHSPAAQLHLSRQDTLPTNQNDVTSSHIHRWMGLRVQRVVHLEFERKASRFKTRTMTTRSPSIPRACTFSSSPGALRTFVFPNSIRFWSCLATRRRRCILCDSCSRCMTSRSDYSDDSPFLLASFPSDEAVKQVGSFCSVPHP